MRAVLFMMFALGFGCRPGTRATLSEAQRVEMTDSVNALLQRGKATFEHPDTSLDPMTDFMSTGDVAFAMDGQLILSRDSVRAMMEEPGPPNSTLDYLDKKIDVLAPALAAVTVRLIGRQDQGNMVAERGGVWSGVMAIRDGRTRIIQQHQSMKPGTLSPKPGASQQ
jgi:hypothetical protein